MTLETKAWDRQNNVEGLNLLMGSQFSSKICVLI